MEKKKWSVCFSSHKNPKSLDFHWAPSINVFEFGIFVDGIVLGKTVTNLTNSRLFGIEKSAIKKGELQGVNLKGCSSEFYVDFSTARHQTSHVSVTQFFLGLLE